MCNRGRGFGREITAIGLGTASDDSFRTSTTGGAEHVRFKWYIVGRGSRGGGHRDLDTTPMFNLILNLT